MCWILASRRLPYGNGLLVMGERPHKGWWRPKNQDSRSTVEALRA
jgi:hypothetical protein